MTEFIFTITVLYTEPRSVCRRKGYLDEGNARWSARDLRETTSSQSISKKDRGIHGVTGTTFPITRS